MNIAGTAHASAVLLDGAGLLVCGASGSGKSSLCHALVDHHAAQWVGDDQLCLAFTAKGLMARAHPQLAGKAERKGQGVVPVPHLERAMMTHQILFADAAVVTSTYCPILGDTWQPNLKSRDGFFYATLPTLTLPPVRTEEAAKRVLAWLHHPSDQNCV